MSAVFPDGLVGPGAVPGLKPVAQLDFDIGLTVIPCSIPVAIRHIELMMRLDLVVAMRAHNGVVGECDKALGLVLFLQIDQFTCIAPTLLVIRVVIVFDEAQWSAAVLDQMAAHRSK